MSERLTQALERRDSLAVRELLENEFEKVARGNYVWLNELADVGYSWDDIAELLLEEANDAPWIYCDHPDQPAQNAQRPALTSEDPGNIAAIPQAQSPEEQSPPQHQTAPQLERCKGCGEPWRRSLPGEDQYRLSSLVQNMSEQLALTQDFIKRLENHAKFADEAYLAWKRKHQWCLQVPTSSDSPRMLQQYEKKIPQPTFSTSLWMSKRHDIKEAVQQPTFSSSPWISKRHDIKKAVQRLCGLGGIAPISRSLDDWNGKVIFEDNFSTSYITYSISPEDDLYTLVPRLIRVLKGFCAAAGTLKGAGLCLDHFTIARIPDASHVSECNVELQRVDIAWAFALCNVLDVLSDTISSDMNNLTELLDIAAKILQPLMLRDPRMTKKNSIKDILHLCCLAAQFLCVGLVSFCQGHVGPIDSVFTNHSQERSVLLGNHTLHKDGKLLHPHIAVRLTKLTCLSEMTEGPLITFSLLDPASESAELHATRLWVPVFNPIRNSQLSLFDLFTDESVYNVEATPEDILYTWGPGQLVSCRDKEELQEELQEWLQSINIGGGVIYYHREFGHRWHWEARSGPEKSPERYFHRQQKIIVGAPVTKNLTQCLFDWKTWRLSCPLVHLAVRPDGWTVNQRQLGLQVGPDHVALQAMQVWSKVPAKLLKEYQLQQGDFGLMEFLGCYVGVQVSCCTGVARRIQLQELLSDLMPKFCITHMGETDWNDWNTKHDIVSGLCRQDVREWLCTLRRSSADAYTTLLEQFHRILSVLEPTGLNRERSQIKIAWPKEGDLHRGIKVSCLDKHLWAQVLADSEEGVTFAYMTTSCLICEGNSCQALRQASRMAPKCLGTAVTQYHGEVEEDAAPTSGPWTLQNGQSYHMWNEKRCIRMRADASPPSSQQYRLTASESAIPSHIVTRHFRSRRFKKNLLRERHHPEDAAVDVLIVDRE